MYQINFVCKENHELEPIIFQCEKGIEPDMMARMLIDIEDDDIISSYTVEKIQLFLVKFPSDNGTRL